VTIAILALVHHARFATAGDYLDPSGFSFTYPEGWTVVRHSDRADVFEGVHPEVVRSIKKNHVDLKKIAVTLVRNGPKEFPENVNFVVGPHIPVDEDSLNMTSKLTKEFESQGFKIEDFQTRIQRVGAYRAIVAEYHVRLPGVAQVMRQKSVMISGGGKSYRVTYSAPTETFEQYEGTFDAILTSFKIPPTVNATFLLGLICGLLGLAAAVVGIRRWRGKKSK
jgi:hypothetical protein